MFARLNQGIYWDKFWPLVDGCTPAGPECRGCWRAAYTHRFTDEFTYYAHANESTPKKPCGWPRFNGQIKIRTDKINLPMHSKKPRVWFVLNDLYHEKIPADFITDAYAVMEECPQHIFIVCTKRPERIESVLYGEEGHFYLGGGDYLSNVWHMITAGNQEMADKRIPELLKLRQASPGWPVLGVSIEPMLEEMEISHWLPDYPLKTRTTGDWKSASALNWIVLGGESGPGARPMHPDWARKVREDCQAAGVPFMFKQWGEWLHKNQQGETKIPNGFYRVGKKAAGRLLDGREYSELPKEGQTK